MSYQECNRILSLFGVTMKDQIFDLLVRQVDRDQSGGLSLNEFAVVENVIALRSIGDRTTVRVYIQIKSDLQR